MNSDEDCAAAGIARRSTGRTRQRPAVIRAARVADAPQIALVHVRSWQCAYRGLLPQVYLDGLDPVQRVGRWERSLAEATDGRDGVLVQTLAAPCLGLLRTPQAATATRIKLGSVRLRRSTSCRAPGATGSAGALWTLRSRASQKRGSIR